jgi:hypothetical protein
MKVPKAKENLGPAYSESALYRKLKGDVEFDDLLRQKLSEDGYTEKELETLKWAGKYTFKIERQPEIRGRSFVEGPWTE